MSLLSMVKRNGPSGFGYGSTGEEVTEGLDLSEKRILITGCNSGIGLETFRVLSMRGAQVLAAARTVEKAQGAIEAVKGGQKATALGCDLSNPESVRGCARRVKELGSALDVLILNAGIMALPKLETIRGLEAQFFTNHIGHFLLTMELLESLSEEARVVVVSSNAHHRTVKKGIDFENLDGARGYQDWLFYGQSKLANLLFARELGRRFEEEGKGRKANALHPGVIRTPLFRHLNPAVGALFAMIGPLGLKSVAEGAATQCYLAVHPEVQANGEYFADCNVKASSAFGEDRELARQLWEKSEEIVAGL